MVRSFLTRAVWGLCFFPGMLFLLQANPLAWADDPAKGDEPAAEGVPAEATPKPADGKPVDFFKALADNRIEAILIPRDAKAMVLQVINKTDQPITIQAPRVFAGLPILEQFLPNNNNGNKVIGKNDKTPQKLVGAFNVKGQNNGQNLGMNNRPNGLNANPLFNIPPEKTLRFTIACVCIEHGKPDPGPHYPYEIRPLDSETDKPQIREVVELLGSGKYNQRVAQIAAWHFSDNLSWEELTDLKIKHLNGVKVSQFTSKEIDQAKQLVAELPSSQSAKADKNATASK